MNPTTPEGWLKLKSYKGMLNQLKMYFIKSWSEMVQALTPKVH